MRLRGLRVSEDVMIHRKRKIRSEYLVFAGCLSLIAQRQNSTSNCGRIRDAPDKRQDARERRERNRDMKMCCREQQRERETGGNDHDHLMLRSCLCISCLCS
ncbi:hypothetical protein QQF64_005247 [Cirrhinus molitorella]|uniref:Uncharacterized protein n=1 Tax=Cirrhinus molitorella TaxID=172907 RepID=A0ABR3MIH4_9TELE